MRKRHAFIIREALLDVRHDWSLKSGLRPTKLRLKTYFEYDLYLKAYNRELDKQARKVLEQTRKELEGFFLSKL